MVSSRSSEIQTTKEPPALALGSRALHRYSKLTAAATFLLLIAGGLVTSTGSGLAVPDWPLSYGMLFPPMVGGVLYEHGHRMIAGFVGILIFAQGIWIARIQVSHWVKRLSLAAVIAVFIQALLGGATVLLLLPPPISIAHGCLGQTVWCLTVCLAVATRPGGFPQESALRPHAGFTAVLGLIVAGLIAVQLVLGAVVRHTGLAAFLHIGGAACVAISVAWLSMRLIRQRKGDPMAAGLAWRLAALVTLQLVLGFAVFFNRASIALRTLHVAVGAALMAQAVILAWHCVRSGRFGISAPAVISMEST